MLSSTIRPSRFLFRAKQSKSQLLRLFLKSDAEIAACHKAFSEAYQNNEDFKVYEFDSCVAEYCGQNLNEGLKESLMHLENSRPSHVFLFGSRDARKSQLLNSNSDSSFLSQAILK